MPVDEQEYLRLSKETLQRTKAMVDSFLKRLHEMIDAEQRRDAG
jgi:hypothetical protein